MLVLTLVHGWVRYALLVPTRLPRHVRVGERPARPARRDALHRARRDADRAHDRAPERPLRRAPRGDHLMAEPLLELRGVSLAFGGHKVVSGLDLHRRQGRDRQRDRAERRRQDDALQPRHRHLRARRRRDPRRRAQHRRPRAAPDHPPRRRPHVPDAAAVPQHVGARERHGRRLRPHQGRRRALDAAHARHAPRGGRDPRAGRGEALVLRRAAQGLSLGSARLQPLVRQPPAARDRARHGDRAEDPAARRARRGHEPGRDARDHRADRAGCAARAATRSS